MRSLAIANQKGGVGKTTTAVHLAHGLSLAGDRVGLLDVDPQGHVALAVANMLGDPVTETGERAGMRPLRSQALGDHCWLLPRSGSGHEGVAASRESTREFIQGLEGDLDWLIVDCPPRLDGAGWFGLTLCKEVLIPVQAEFLTTRGLPRMMRALDGVRESHPGRAALLGVLVTMLDPADPEAREAFSQLRSSLGAQLMECVIFRDPQLARAASRGCTVFELDLGSAGARAYGELVREVRYD